MTTLDLLPPATPAAPPPAPETNGTETSGTESAEPADPTTHQPEPGAPARQHLATPATTTPDPITTPDDRPRNKTMIFWCALITAIACDVAATYALTASDGFRHAVPSVLAVGGFLVTTYLFGVAITGLGPSVSYAAFGALGTAAVAGIGVLTGDSANWAKLGALTLIIAGVGLLPVTERL